jgi:ABC-type multidrug transport system fused ATPase/permease subunit
MIKKLKILFTRNELIQSINLIVFIIIGLIFEVFGLAIFIPVFSILLEQDIDSGNIIIKSINDFFVKMGLLESKLFLLIIIASTFFIKTIVQILIIYKQKKTVTNIIRDLSNRMFIKYLNQPYIYYTKVNRSRIVQFLQTEILFLFNYFEALLSLIAEVIIFLGIYLLIFLIEPLGVVFLNYCICDFRICLLLSFNWKIE